MISLDVLIEADIKENPRKHDNDSRKTRDAELCGA